jgi:hypothetical protein
MPHIFMCERSGDNLIKTFCPRKQNDMVLCGEVLGHFPIAIECLNTRKLVLFNHQYGTSIIYTLDWYAGRAKACESIQGGCLGLQFKPIFQERYLKKNIDW